MISKQPLLSICIPTYNRSKYLKEALDAYISNKEFDKDVEIVISDNASEDETREVVKGYSMKYSNIRYYRNNENLIDKNMSLALDRGTGLYLKLMNDNLVISEGGLHYLKEKIKENLSNNTALLFTNDIIFNRKKVDCVICNKFDDLVESLSYVVTSIMIFGCWKRDWDLIKDKQKYVKLRLCQDDWVYQMMERRGKLLLYTGSFCTPIILDKRCRTGYNWFEVHVANYYAILQPYIDKGLVTKKALSKDKRSYLKNLPTQIVMAYMYNIMPEWQFDMTGASRIMWRHFKSEPLYYAMMFTFPIWGSYKVLKFFFNNRCKTENA